MLEEESKEEIIAVIVIGVVIEMIWVVIRGRLERIVVRIDQYL